MRSNSPGGSSSGGFLFYRAADEEMLEGDEEEGDEEMLLVEGARTKMIGNKVRVPRILRLDAVGEDVVKHSDVGAAGIEEPKRRAAPDFFAESHAYLKANGGLFDETLQNWIPSVEEKREQGLRDDLHVGREDSDDGGGVLLNSMVSSETTQWQQIPTWSVQLAPDDTEADMEPAVVALYRARTEDQISDDDIQALNDFYVRSLALRWMDRLAEQEKQVRCNKVKPFPWWWLHESGRSHGGREGGVGGGREGRGG